MADMVPFYFPADTFTCHATGAVTGRRIVGFGGGVTGDNPNVAHATGGDAGVAAQDAASGAKVTVFTVGVLAVEAGAAVTAGARVASDSSGRAVTASTGYFGRAIDAAAQAGDIVRVFVDRGIL